MDWIRSHRADAAVVPLADRHYNRQKIGAPQFAPPGRCLVLKTEGPDAFWITSWPFAEYVKHAWPGAWVCSAFRNESERLSSELIRQAVAATLARYGAAPELGMVTFVDPNKTRRKRDPGRCFIRAGFRRVGFTKGGLVALQLLPGDMPAPHAPQSARDDEGPLFCAHASLPGRTSGLVSTHGGGGSSGSTSPRLSSARSAFTSSATLRRAHS